MAWFSRFFAGEDSDADEPRLAARDEKRIFFASLAAPLLFVLITILAHGFFQPFSEVKSDAYLPLAEHLYSFGAYTYSATPPYVLEAMHVPGYPLFLAYTAIPTGSIIPTLLLQTLLFALSAVFLFRLARGIFPRRAALLGSLLYGLEPFTGFIVASALSEALFLFLFLGGLLCARRALERSNASLAAFAGLTLALSILVRPIALYVAPLILIAVILAGFRRRHAAILVFVGLLAFAAPLGLWMARNYDAYGVATLSTKGPYTVYFWYVGQLLEYREGWNAVQTEEYLVARAHEAYPAVDDRKDLRDPRYAAFLKEDALALLAESPLLYAKIQVMSMGTFFLSDGYRLLMDNLGVPLPALPNITKTLAGGDVASIASYLSGNPITLLLFTAGFLFWAASFLLACLSALFAWRRREPPLRRLLIVCFLLGMFALAALTGPVAQPRYRIVATPFIFILAAYSAHAMSRQRSGRTPQTYE